MQGTHIKIIIFLTSVQMYTSCCSVQPQKGVIKQTISHQSDIIKPTGKEARRIFRWSEAIGILPLGGSGKFLQCGGSIGILQVGGSGGFLRWGGAIGILQVGGSGGFLR